SATCGATAGRGGRTIPPNGGTDRNGDERSGRTRGPQPAGSGAATGILPRASAAGCRTTAAERKPLPRDGGADRRAAARTDPAARPQTATGRTTAGVLLR